MSLICLLCIGKMCCIIFLIGRFIRRVDSSLSVLLIRLTYLNVCFCVLCFDLEVIVWFLFCIFGNSLRRLLFCVWKVLRDVVTFTRR